MLDLKGIEKAMNKLADETQADEVRY